MNMKNGFLRKDIFYQLFNPMPTQPMTIAEYIKMREEEFEKWIEDTLNKNDDEFLRHYVQSITLIHSETINTVLQMMREMVENNKIRKNPDIAGFKWVEIKCDYNNALNEVLSLLPLSSESNETK